MPGGAVIGAAGAVLLRPPAELRPDVHEHAVGEPARLEVALEGVERVGGQLQVVGEIGCLVVVRVVATGSRQRDDVQRHPGGEHRREAGEAAREGVVALRVGHRAGRRLLVALRAERSELLVEPGRLARCIGCGLEPGIVPWSGSRRACRSWRPSARRPRPRRRAPRSRSCPARRRRRPASSPWRARAAGSSRARGPGAGCPCCRPGRDSGRASPSSSRSSAAPTSQKCREVKCDWLGWS